MCSSIHVRQCVKQCLVCTVESVDGLVGVAYKEKIRLLWRHDLQEGKLQRVHVLRFINGDVTELKANGLCVSRVFGCFIDDIGEEVVEVDDAAFFLRLFICIKDFKESLFAKRNILTC